MNFYLTVQIKSLNLMIYLAFSELKTEIYIKSFNKQSSGLSQFWTN